MLYRLSRRRCLHLAAGLALGAPIFSLTEGCGSGGSISRDPSRAPDLDRFAVTDLGLPDGATGSGTATAINNRSEIVGVYQIGTRERAFYWSGGRVKDIGTLNGLPDSADSPPYAIARGINDSGVVLVDSGISSFSVREFGYFLWQDGGQIPLPSSARVVTDINNRSEVVGEGNDNPIPAIWRDGAYQPVTLPGVDPTTYRSIQVYVIGNSGQILGALLSTDPELGGTLYRYFLLADGQVAFLDSLPQSGVAVGDFTPIPITLIQLNDRGQILGARQNVVNLTAPFLWENGSARELETGGPYFVDAQRMNNFGQIVGGRSPYMSDVLKPNATLWLDGKAHDLNSRIPGNSGWSLSRATDINDRGQIVGSGIRNGRERPFLLTPV